MEKGKCISSKHWKNGNLKFEEILLDDNSTILKNYSSNGKIQDETHYDTDNFKSGIRKVYHSNGVIKLEECYVHGEIVFQKTFNKFNQQLTTDYYKDGNLLKRIIMMVGILEFQ